MLQEKYGGYIIEDDSGAIAAVCTDELCAVIDEKSKGIKSPVFHSPSSGVPLKNYTIEIPESAKVCSNWRALSAAAMQRPHSGIEERYGGIVIEEDGVVVVVVVVAADEGLSAEAVAKPEQLEFVREDMAAALGQGNMCEIKDVEYRRERKV
jgi:hypothetical protein